MFKPKKRKGKYIRKFKQRQEPRVHTLKKQEYRWTSILLVKKSGTFTTRMYLPMIRAFRKFIKKKKYRLKFRFRINYMVTRKSRQSRMGKGKGKIKGFLIKLPRNKIFLVARGISTTRIWLFFRRIERNMSLKFSIKKTFRPREIV